MDAEFIDLLPDLALFVAIGKADSLSAAARTTGVPVARLSRRLAALEKAVGVRLVERTSRRFRLTVDGEAYLACLEPTLEALVGRLRYGDRGWARAEGHAASDHEP